MNSCSMVELQTVGHQNDLYSHCVADEFWVAIGLHPTNGYSTPTCPYHASTTAPPLKPCLSGQSELNRRSWLQAAGWSTDSLRKFTQPSCWFCRYFPRLGSQSAGGSWRSPVPPERPCAPPS